MAPLPADLMDRRVEITGPTDRKMVGPGQLANDCSKLAVFTGA